jgi:ligand-binding sensor domain-containing protein
MCKIVARRFNSPGKTLAVILCVSLFYLSFGTGPVHALDPNKRLTQYVHAAWRTQGGSPPAGIFSVAQTTDGFLWFTSVSQGMYRFDGIRFVSWTLAVDGRTIESHRERS